MERKVWRLTNEAFVICIGTLGMFIGILIAFLWPRTYGLEFLSYPNRLLVLNPGTGLTIGTNVFCFLWVCFKIVKQKGRGANLIRTISFYGSLTLCEWIGVWFPYAYDPAMVIRLGTIWIIFLGTILLIVQSRTTQRPV